MDAINNTDDFRVSLCEIISIAKGEDWELEHVNNCYPYVPWHLTVKGNMCGADAWYNEEPKGIILDQQVIKLRSMLHG